MAERVASKASKRAPKASSSPAKAKAAPPRAGKPRPDDLAAECTRLQEELAAAQARIRTLEAQREALANRIDWVIDSLHSLLDE